MVRASWKEFHIPRMKGQCLYKVKAAGCIFHQMGASSQWGWRTGKDLWQQRLLPGRFVSTNACTQGLWGAIKSHNGRGDKKGARGFGKCRSFSVDHSGQISLPRQAFERCNNGAIDPWKLPATHRTLVRGASLNITGSTKWKYLLHNIHAIHWETFALGDAPKEGFSLRTTFFFFGKKCFNSQDCRSEWSWWRELCPFPSTSCSSFWDWWASS